MSGVLLVRSRRRGGGAYESAVTVARLLATLNRSEYADLLGDD